jgi:steroid delta-isomerase-like uncharacterized protein
MAQQAVLSPAEIAKASLFAYNDKNWNAARASLAASIVYEEFGTDRTIRGVDDVLAAWQGWARAFPDSKATLHNEYTTGNTIVLEMTWRGTHSGPLQTPQGELAPTGRQISMRACQVIEIANDKAKVVRHYFNMNTMLKQLGLK